MSGHGSGPQQGSPMPFGAAFAADPGPVWDQLNRTGTVHRIATPDGPPAWLVTGYEEVRRGLMDDRLGVCKAAARGGDYRGFELPPQLDDHLLNNEPPDHTRLRDVVATDLAPRMVERMRAALEHDIDQLMRPVEKRGHGDLVAEVAAILPLRLISDVLSLPPETRAALAEWASGILAPTTGHAPRARDSLTRMVGIVTRLIELKRGSDSDDLGSRLVAAQDDGALSEPELSSMLFYLIFVWYEVSVDFLGNSMLHLLTAPDQLASVRRDSRLVRRAVEELLRYEAPQMLAAPRFPDQDVEIAGTTIPAGSTVLFSLAAANRDPGAFAASTSLDVSREPNPHLSFGHGIHTCLGAPLVRLQGEICIGEFARRFGDWRLSVDRSELGWRPGFRHRGVLELPVSAA